MEIIINLAIAIIIIVVISLHSWNVIKKLYKGCYGTLKSLFMLCLLVIYLILFLSCLSYILEIAIKYYYFIQLKNILYTPYPH